MSNHENIRRGFEDPPVFSVTIDAGELLLNWGNSHVMRYGNSLLDHLMVIDGVNTYIAFPTIGNEDILDVLEVNGWEVIPDEGQPIDVIEFAAEQIIKEAMALQ